MHNKALSRRDFIKVVAVASAGLALTNADRVLAQLSSDPLVEELAKTAYTALTEEQMSAWWKSYQTLSSDQLELLNDLFAEHLARTLNARGEQGNTIANAFRQLRGEVNRISLELYKVPFNQLDSSQLNTILDSIAGSSVAQTIRTQASIQGSCACYDYPYTTVPGGYGTPGNGISYISASQWRSNCGDCDWDVAFPVDRHIIRYVDIFGQGHYNQLGGYFIFRHTSGNTRVVFGFLRTLFWQGHPYFLLEDFRLD